MKNLFIASNLSVFLRIKNGNRNIRKTLARPLKDKKAEIKHVNHEGTKSTKVHEGFSYYIFFVSFVSALAASCLRGSNATLLSP